MDEEINIETGIHTTPIPPLPPRQDESSEYTSSEVDHTAIYGSGQIDPRNGALPATLVNNGSSNALDARLQPEVLDATGVAVVLSENEEEEQLALRRRRYLLGGAAGCFVLALVIIIPVVTLLPGDDTPIVVASTGVPSSAPSPMPTSSPTEEPVSPELAEILQTLQQQQQPSDSTIADDPWWTDKSSAAYRAAKWIADVDTLPISSTNQLLQRFALTTLYYSTSAVDPNSNVENWQEDWIQCGVYSTGCRGNPWLSPNVHECDWNYVTCENIDDNQNARRRTENRLLQEGGDTRVVVQILFPLQGNNLHGVLPPQLSLLSQLQVFSAANNWFGEDSLLEDMNTNSTNATTTMDEEAEALTDNDDNAILLHPIDEAFHGLSTLRVLNLVGNGLAGTLPVMIGQDNPELELLLLSNNLLTGEIPPEVSAMTSLLELQLQSNQIQGTIPSSIGLLHASLRFLNLAENQLTGMPTEIYELTALTALHLSNNPNLTGAFSVGQLSNMNDFGAAFTQLYGPLPDVSFAKMTQLEKLDLQSAELTGTLSEDLALWNASLQILRLQDNQFTGSLPAALDLLTVLGELRLEGNAFGGSISEAVCARRGQGFQQLATLTVDCSVECSCCDDYDCGS